MVSSAIDKFCALAGGLASVFASSAAFAQGMAEAKPEPQAFVVEFRSSTRCTDATEFTRWLRSFTPRVRPATPGEPALTFVVQLVPTEAGVGGRLTLREADGKETLREVPGLNCHEVILGMALISALTIDPLAIIPPDVMRSPSVVPARPVQAPRPRAQPPDDLQEESALGFNVGLRAAEHTAIAPGIAFGGAAYASVAYDFGGVWVPSARIAAHWARATAERQAGGGAEFTWLAARLSLCPARWAPNAAVSVRPCVVADAGRLQGRGVDVDFAVEESIFWSAAGVELEFDATVAGPLSIGAEVAVVLPFRRDLFFFASNETIHQIPAVGMTVGAGAALHFF